VEKTKSEKTRIIPMSGRLKKELLRLKGQNGQLEYVFLYPRTGRPMCDVKRAFATATRLAQIKGLRFHDLRHTFASRLVRNGVDIITVRDLLGHYSVEVTQRYTHSNAFQKRQAVGTLDAEESDHKNSVHIVSTQKGPNPEAYSSTMN
jgi:integrase